MKSGFITPTLYFLDQKYRLVNSKTVDTVNFLLDRNAIGPDLTRYREYLETIDEALEELAVPLFEDSDTFDSFCHWMCDKRLGGYARVEAQTGPPDEGEPVSLDELEPPQNHWQAIYYLVQAGNLLGFKTYVADPRRKAFDQRLGDAASLTEVPVVLRAAPQIEKVDVIWYRPAPPFFLFEVEDGGTMREALHRLYNAIGFDARFFVVSPLHNRGKFDKWLATAPFGDFEERYNFRTYADLFDFYKEVCQFTSVQSRFLSL